MPVEEPLESFAALSLIHESKHAVFVIEFEKILELGA